MQTIIYREDKSTTDHWREKAVEPYSFQKKIGKDQLPVCPWRQNTEAYGLTMKERFWGGFNWVRG